MNLGFDELVLTRSICKKSYYCFLKELWGTVPTNTSFQDNWHIKLLCDELQFLAEWYAEGEKPNHHPKYDSAPYILVINQVPGSSKSMLTSVFFQPWVWTWFPKMVMIGSSYNLDLALRLSDFSRQVVKSDRYRKLFPHLRIGAQDAKGDFANIYGGERIASGQYSITGKHADFLLDDDPLDPQELASEAALNQANGFWDGVLSQRKKSQARAVMILIMQRLSDFDTTGILLSRAADPRSQQTGFRLKHICLPAVWTDNVSPKSWGKYYFQYPDDPIKNGLFDPSRQPKSVLLQKEQASEYNYACQYLQRPVPLGGGMFKVGCIIRKKPEDAAKVKFIKIVRYWDKASTQGDGCFSVGTKMAKDIDGHFWVLHVKRGQWDSAWREALIQKTAGEDGDGVVIGVEQEPGSSGVDSAKMTVRGLAGFRVITERPTGKKEERADPLSSQCNAGNVYMVSDTDQAEKWNTPWLEELGLFPNGRNKDQVDSASGAFRMLAQPTHRVGGWRK